MCHADTGAHGLYRQLPGAACPHLPAGQVQVEPPFPSAPSAAGLSAALFAPGWVWEQAARGNYAQQDQQFWDSIEVACGAPQPALVHLPFVCTFNTGAGQRMYSEVVLAAGVQYRGLQTCSSSFRRAPLSVPLAVTIP